MKITAVPGISMQPSHFLIRNILILFIIFAIAFEPAILFSAPHGSSPRQTAEKIRNTINEAKILSKIKSGEAGNLSPESNPFGLIHQKVIVHPKPGLFRKKNPGKPPLIFDLFIDDILWHEKLPEPPFGIGNRVEVILEGGDVHFVFGNLVHVIEDLEIQSIARDQELLALLSRSGEIWIINMATLSDFIFKGPVPVFRILTVDGTDKSDRIMFLSMKVLAGAPRPIAISKVLTSAGIEGLVMGDLAVISGELSPRITRVVPREDIFSSAGAQIALLTHLSFIIDGRAADANQLIDEESEKLEEFLKEETGAELFFNRNLPGQLRKISPDALQRITNEINNYCEHGRHNCTIPEWQMFVSKAEKLFEEKESEALMPELSMTGKIRGKIQHAGKRFSRKLKGSLSPGNLLKLASTLRWFTRGKPAEKACKLAGGVGAACVAVWSGALMWEGVTGAVRLASHRLATESVLALGKTYISYNILSSTALYGMLGAVLAVGAIGGYYTNRKVNRAITTAGLRLASLTVGWPAWLPFVLLRQKNLPLALKGKAGYRHAINTLWAGRETLGEKREKILEKIAARKRVKTLAMVLSHAVIADHKNIDTAALLLHETDILSGTARELTTEQIEKWLILSDEIRQKLNHLSEKELLDLSGEDLARAFEIAREAEKSVNLFQQTRRYEVLSRIKTVYRFIMEKTPLQVLRHIPTPMKSYDLYRTLMQSEIDRFSSDTIMNQFKVNYLMMPLVMGWTGAFANPENPPSGLAADPDAFLWTNPKILGDMMEQIYLYTVPLPTARYLVFGKAQKTPCEYLPLLRDKYVEINGHGEVIIPKYRREKLLPSVANYMRQGFNFREARYGSRFLFSLQRIVQTIHSAYLSGLTIRLFAGIPAGQAFMALTYMRIMGKWYLGWIWILLVRGLQLHEEKLEEGYEKFIHTATLLDREIRFGKLERAALHLKELVQMYPDEKLPHGISKSALLTNIEDFLKAPGKNNFSFASRFATNMAEMLLKHAEKTPPTPAAPHSALITIVNSVGAISATLIGTFLIYDAYLTTVPGIARAAGLSLLLYTGTYYGFDYAIPKVIDTVKNNSKKLRSFSSSCKRFFKSLVRAD